MAPSTTDSLRMALPKGRMQASIFSLLAESGVDVQVGDRDYRPSLSLADVDVKILKPQNIVEMLHAGLRDVGFAGADWVAELGADLVEIIDTGLDAVRLVAAAPADFLVDGALPARPLIVASEYGVLTNAWINDRGLDARFVKTYGATEVFPPEDADCIVDNTSTGSTLRANNLSIVDVLMTSSTRLYASQAAYDDPAKRDRIDSFALLVRSVLEARKRVMLEVNVPADRLEGVIDVLPCMREPTISPLHGNGAYAVKVAVLRDLLPNLVPELKKRGGTDVVVTNPNQIVP